MYLLLYYIQTCSHKVSRELNITTLVLLSSVSLTIGVLMGILDAVTQTNNQAGLRAVISGVEKIGKTTLCCNAPRALLVPLEVGAIGIQVHKTPMLEHFDHVMQLLDEIIASAQTGQFAYKSLVFDSATALERMIHQAVLMRDPLYSPGNKKTVTIDSALGGYGKGHAFANELFGNFLAKCDVLAVNAGINIILTCHVFAAEVLDPTVGNYTTWDLLLHSPKNQKNYGKREMLTQWADVIGFIHEPIFINEGQKMNMGVSANQGRVLAVTRTPGYVAGNRFGVVNNISLPKENGWNQLAQEIYAANGADFFNRDVV